MLRKSLVHEGWKEDKLLPEDWLFKVKEGNVGRTNGYKMVCKEGQLLESAKAAMDYIQVLKYTLCDENFLFLFISC